MQGKKLWMGTMMCTIALCALLLAGCGSKTDLRFRPAVGDTRAITVRAETNVTMDITAVLNKLSLGPIIGKDQRFG
ncbi:MAG: hypothetical protein GWP08_18265 [Nitrospiraceae bacterium]|nr:hypothetical protein [Nitrospiraceae bacterium]